MIKLKTLGNGDVLTRPWWGQNKISKWGQFRVLNSQATKETVFYLQQAREAVVFSHCSSPKAMDWLLAVDSFLPLILQVIEQTNRRVLQEEKVPAQEKIVSLFEPHTDIIAKSHRKITFGHKINITTGKSNLILDVVIEKGNPADSERFIPMLKRQDTIYNGFPEKTAADGGYVSLANLEQAKMLGIKDVAFHKKCGIHVEDMVRSQWIYRQLKNFRAGVEANISCLKRAYGLTRCLWKGFEKFRAYVWSSVVAYNLSVFARFVSKSPT